MARVGRAEIEVSVTGDLLPLVRAFGIMGAALAAYGHEFRDDEMTELATAADILQGRTVEVLPLDVNVAANLEPRP